MLPREAWSSTPISAVAARPTEIVECHSQDRLDDVAAQMQSSHDRRAVVLDGGRLVGILTPSDAIAFGESGPSVCFIDCDSMVFHGRQALAAVETSDWQIPSEFSEPPRTRAADDYKLGLLILRLFARSHDARRPETHIRHVPSELRGLLVRSLGADARNRPPAGEWQRAVSDLLVRGGLNVRYPGPASAPVIARRTAVVAPRPRDARRPQSPPRVPRPRVARPAPSVPRARSTGHPVGFAWVVVAAVLFVVIFARLFAAAIPAQGSPGSTSGAAGGGGGGGAPYQFYYYGPDGR